MAEIPEQVPRWGNKITVWIARLWLWITGWKLDMTFPNVPKMVLVAAPHTSNWDGVHGITAAIAADVRLTFFAKHSMFKFPFRRFLGWVGVVPIDRGNAGSVVQQTINKINEAEKFVLVLAVEGTRSRVEKWKMGFYHIARETNIPMVLGYMDYKTKVIGTGPVIYPSGDMQADLEKIYSFYRTVNACHPERFAVPSIPAVDAEIEPKS